MRFWVDQPRAAAGTQRQQPRIIEVRGNDDPTFGERTLQNLFIGSPRQTHRRSVNSIMPSGRQPLDDLRHDGHVDQEPKGQRANSMVSSSVRLAA